MKREPKVGDILEGTVVRVYPRYAILLFPEGRTGLLHISELSHSFIRNFTGFVQVGNIYKVKVIETDPGENFLKVSLKQLTGSERRSSLKRELVDQDRVSFEALEQKLPEWIKEENDEKGERQ